MAPTDMAKITPCPAPDGNESVAHWDRFYRDGAGNRSKMKAAQAARDKEYIVSVPRGAELTITPTPKKKKKKVKRK